MAGRDGTAAGGRAGAGTAKKAAPAGKAPAAAAPATKAAPTKAAPTKAAPTKAAATKAAATKAAPTKVAPTKTAATKTAATKAVPKQGATTSAPVESVPVTTAPAGAGPAAATSAARPRRTVSAGRAAAALAVLPGEQPWTAGEVSGLTDELRAEIARLGTEVTDADAGMAELMRDFGDGAGEDQADQGSKTFEREHEMSLANNARDLLAQDERALARIADGSYGRCESCGEPIGKLRLQAFPRATLCMTCKMREERR